jgi:hypothetical protein
MSKLWSICSLGWSIGAGLIRRCGPDVHLRPGPRFGR